MDVEILTDDDNLFNNNGELIEGVIRECGACDMGWKHGCCCDVCRSCYDAVDCTNAKPCACNPDGDVW